MEDEGSDRESANAATGTTGWGRWWGRGRVSRERLVGEALELLFRLVMSGDVALTALRAHAPLVAALRKVADGGGQRLLYDDRVSGRRRWHHQAPTLLS